MDAALVGVCTSLVEGETEGSTFCQVIGFPAAIVSNNSMHDRILIRPGNSRADRNGNGIRIELITVDGYIYLAARDGVG